ncbi:YheT family hydrolase [Derxia gummosa]|uniref:YheT family hydrolase n=1 Tax=Derxia gummosa DSM 723 TaxID=1121388 RepID=A0A8B6X8K7_9BURK|nr:alpha/beta fold hydrolase [Derxia gummosa]
MAGYRAPAWLRLGPAAGHAQTILPALLARCPATPLRRERWDTETDGRPDGDFIDVDFVDGEAGRPWVVLFHGLEGSSRSHYARALMHALRIRGWTGVIPHFRGCSGEPNRLARAYHSGDSAEVGWVLRRIAARAAGAPLYAAGVSLGGNALLKWLGESGADARFVTAAAGISAPLDLMAGGAAISRGLSMVYTRMFLRTLRVKVAAKLAAHPAHPLLASGRTSLDAIRAARTLREFDNLYTAPMHGYRDTDDYWTRASSKPLLRHIVVPTLVLNARNDPFLPAEALPGPAEVSAVVTLEQPAEGGHVGFATGAFPGRLDWLPARILGFFDDHTDHG